MQKGLQCRNCKPFLWFGRNGGIRTRDPLHPMQVRYQAALRSESLDYIGFLHSSKVRAFIIRLLRGSIGVL